MTRADQQLSLAFPETNLEEPSHQGDKRLPSEFTEVPEECRPEVQRRYKYIDAIRQRIDSGRKFKGLRRLTKEVALAIGDVNPPSRKTLCRWYRRFVASGGNIRSLIPLVRNRGNWHRRIHPEVLKIIGDIVVEQYLSPRRTSIRTAWISIILRIHEANRFRSPDDELIPPSYYSVRREVRRLNKRKWLAARNRKGTAVPRAKVAKLRLTPTRPLERVEIGHTQLDVLVVDSKMGMPLGRPWLSIAIDLYSGCCLGIYLSLEPPSYLAVMRCLFHAIAPKSGVKVRYLSVVRSWDAHGLPEAVVVANGREFHSKHFEDACNRLGILIEYAPVRRVYWKGAVERQFRNFNELLPHLQLGTTFSDHPENADDHAEKRTVIDMRTIDELLHIYIVDHYNQRLHPETKQIPAIVWKRGIEAHPPALPPRPEELEILLQVTEERVISRSGIKLHGLFYNSGGLAPLWRGMRKGERVRVKFDPTDLSLIHVFDAAKGTVITVPAVNRAYTRGLTLSQHRVVMESARRQAFEKASAVHLVRAKRRIVEIVTRGQAQAKRNAYRQVLVRYLNHAEVGQGAMLEKRRRVPKRVVSSSVTAGTRSHTRTELKDEDVLKSSALETNNCLSRKEGK